MGRPEEDGSASKGSNQPFRSALMEARYEGSKSRYRGCKLIQEVTRMRMVERDPISSCWNWRDVNDLDTVFVSLTGRRGPIRTHRFSWELFKGPIPGDLAFLPTCTIVSV